MSQWQTPLVLGKFAGHALGKIEVPRKGDFVAALLAVGMAREYHGGKRSIFQSINEGEM